MASISTTITAVDRMSGPLRQIYQNARILRNELETIGRLSSLNNVGASMNNLTRNVVNNVNIINLQLNQVNNNIRDAFNSSVVNNFNQQVREGQSAVGGFEGKIRSLVGAYIGLRGIQKIVGLSDALASSSAKLSVIVDDKGSIADMDRKIFASAQRSRASYMSTMAMVSKLANNAGEAFANGDETIQFAENLNKLFVINGATQTEVASASLQLTQALGSGVLRGEELNAVFEAAPAVIRTIADYLHVPIGQIRAMAKEGKITADIVKNALLGATDDINKRFNSMPMTWGQVWTNIVNRLIIVSRPLLEFISMLAQNWAILEPIVVSLAAALGAYIITLGIYTAIKSAAALAEAVHAAAQTLATNATFAATAAQHGFNAALLACPITWILLIIIAVIAAIYAVVAAINKVTGSTISATGIISGAIAAAGAFIWNIIVGLVNAVIGIGVELWNLIAIFANFFANVFNNPVGAIMNLFSNLFDFILGIVQAAAKLIDTVLNSDLSSAVEGFRNDFAKSVGDIVGDQTIVMEKLNASDFQFKGLDYGNAFNKGYKFGQGIDNKINGMFGGGSLKLNNLGAMNGTIPADVGKIKDNTGAMHDKLSKSEEDLKYLRDIAARDAINRFTTAEIKIEQHNNNNINSDMDLDGVVDYLVTTTAEAVNSVAEGVHI